MMIANASEKVGPLLAYMLKTHTQIIINVRIDCTLSTHVTQPIIREKMRDARKYIQIWSEFRISQN